jgi:hypothetical protein
MKAAGATGAAFTRSASLARRFLATGSDAPRRAFRFSFTVRWRLRGFSCTRAIAAPLSAARCRRSPALYLRLVIASSSAACHLRICLVPHMPISTFLIRKESGTKKSAR